MPIEMDVCVEREHHASRLGHGSLRPAVCRVVHGLDQCSTDVHGEQVTEENGRVSVHSGQVGNEKLVRLIADVRSRPFAEGILQHPRMNFTLTALIWNSAMDLLQFLVRFPDYKVNRRRRIYGRRTSADVTLSPRVFAIFSSNCWRKFKCSCRTRLFKILKKSSNFIRCGQEREPPLGKRLGPIF